MSDATSNEPIDARPAIYRESGLLGTVIELRVAIEGVDDVDAVADACHSTAIAEIERLQQVFSAYDPASVFCRWRSGNTPATAPELVELLHTTLDWQERSGGGFNPLAGLLSDRWKRAEADGRPPADDELLAIAASIRMPRFSMLDGEPTVVGDCSAMNLNAIAKGYIVDRAIQRVAEQLAGAERWWVSVNAGGDLAHRGAGSLRVGIENPHRPYDNEPPLTTVTLDNAALATSGLARRGFRVDGHWYGHVLDPHTGHPVDAIASISVVGPDAESADVVATAAGVLPPDRAIEFIEALDSVEAMIVDSTGQRWHSHGWPALEVS
ncbi:MAG: FAD:protein FMN transferase [Acidimicrobiales bacterium]